MCTCISSSTIFYVLIGFSIMFSKDAKGTSEVINLLDNCKEMSHECTFWDFECASFGCINMAKFCDGHPDCPDGSDEIAFNQTLESNGTNRTDIPCNNNMNKADKTCMLPCMYGCDSIQNCRGHVDESEEVCGIKNRYVKRCYMEGCMNSKVLNCPECREFTTNCDEEYCKYRNDEDLNHDCASTIFRCKSGECLSAHQFCDGTIDCEDGSDEMVKADAGSSEDGVLCVNKWNYNARQCVLPHHHVCDGIDHCENRTDECTDDCMYSFFCENGNCITRGLSSAPIYVLDGRDDCGDSSDEWNADFSVKMHFRCDDPNNTLLALEKFCDGVVDCPNGADERNHSHLNNSEDAILCSNNRVLVPLNISCVVPGSHVCDGFSMCDNFKDEDPDECSTTNDSLFQCQNGEVVNNLAKVQCNFVQDCKDGSDECLPLSFCNKTFTCISDGKCLPFSKFCDGIPDCEDRSDEIHDETGGFMCENKHKQTHYAGKCVLPKSYLCDGIDHCVNRTDECQNNCDKSFYCDSGECLDRKHFCDGNSDCKDLSDEKIIGTGFKCSVRRKNEIAMTCVLPQFMLSDSVGDCADKSDLCFEATNQPCFRCLSEELYISPKQVCDGMVDCPDLSDECLCEKTTINKSIPRVCENLCELTHDPKNICTPGQVVCDAGETHISFAEVCDNNTHCSDGTDEDSCTKRNGLKENSSRTKNFTCVHHSEPEVAVACDGIVECGDFTDECSRVPSDISKDISMSLNSSSESGTEPPFKCGAKTLKVCSTLWEDVLHLYHCSKTDMKFTHSSMICNGIEDCIDSSIPTIPPSSKSRLRTWSDFSGDEQECPHRFLCNRSRPVDPDLVSIHRHQVCDGIIDCMKEEDESENICGNLGLRRFYCETRRGSIDFSNEGGPQDSKRDPLFVPMLLMFDGKKDCWDGSDECPSIWFDDNPFSSRHRMIKDAFLNVLVWVMAILAISGNIVVICHTSRKLIKSRRSLSKNPTGRRATVQGKGLSPMMKTNCILVLNLAVSDLLMGFYLFSLAVQNVLTSGNYCQVDYEWRTSQKCAAFGTLALISVQCSVFIMIILTTYRMLAVLRPFKADSVRARYTGVLIVAAWLFSIIVSCLPRLESLEDYFTSAAWISHSTDFFASNAPNKPTLFQFVKRLQILDNHGSKAKTFIRVLGEESNVTWSAIRESLTEVYPTFWPQYKMRGYFGFYSSNSVCLPQMFVTVDHSSWGYSAAIITFDLSAFIYILISYLVIYHDAKRVVASNRNDDENRTMQARITRLVVTDFACWVPVCVISFLSLAGLDISPLAYAFAAIVLLPINSALNPILYSNVTNVLYNSCIKPGSAMARKRLLLSRQSFNRLRKRTSYTRASMAASMTSNDYLQSPESVPMLSNATNSAISQNSASVITTTTRI